MREKRRRACDAGYDTSRCHVDAEDGSTHDAENRNRSTRPRREEIISSFKTSTEVDYSVVPEEFTKFTVITDLTPEIPGPFQDVVVRLISYSIDLNRSKINWSVNGKSLGGGTGDIRRTITTGGLGSATIINATITAPDGRTQTEQIRIAPATVDLVWQADDEYVPPFYKGKALYSHQAPITIVALPAFVRRDGARINPKNLIYKWIRDTVVLDAQSGYGKDSIVLSETTPSDDVNITVEVSSTDDTIRAKGVMQLTSTNPRVLMYENHPLLGIRYEKALRDEVPLNGEEMEIRAVPYFFSSAGINNLVYKWFLNDNPFANQIKPSVVVRSAGEKGVASVGVRVDHKNNTFQRSSSSVMVNFTQN